MIAAQRPTARRQLGQRAQALAETAVVLPVIVLLVLGVWNASGLIAAQNQATQASQAGARVAAELGNDNNAPPDPTAVDQKIVATAVTTMKGAAFTAVTQVDIYQPINPSTSGVEQPGDLIDSYEPDGTPIGSPQYTLDLRSQAPLSEQYVGVKVYFTYTSPAPLLSFFSGQKSAYTVMQFPPVE